MTKGLSVTTSLAGGVCWAWSGWTKALVTVATRTAGRSRHESTARFTFIGGGVQDFSAVWSRDEVNDSGDELLSGIIQRYGFRWSSASALGERPAWPVDGGTWRGSTKRLHYEMCRVHIVRPASWLPPQRATFVSQPTQQRNSPMALNAMRADRISVKSDHPPAPVDENNTLV